jgi:transcriptional regulator with XRE-family HTH domain
MRRCRMRELELRRREVGMTYAALAKRSGVSQATVVRILRGLCRAPSLPNVEAIARALGMSLRLVPEVTATELRRRRASELAGRLVGHVQGTMSLEGQAVDRVYRDELAEQTLHELMAGPAKSLWRD